MLRLAVRSFGTLLLCGLLGSVAIFVALRVSGGDVASVILGQSATPQALAQLRHQLALDRSRVVQSRHWLWDFVRGDLGVSAATGYDIGYEIRQRTLVTVPMVLMSLVGASLLALVFGTLAALNARRLRGTAIDAISQVGICVPVFWLGL